MNYLNINDKNLLLVNKDLNQLLADYSVYYQKLRSFHWNVLGKNFFDLHEKFEELYNDARIKIDEVAERILTLRYHPISKMSEYLKLSKVDEVSAMITDGEMVLEILKDHKKLLSQMKIVISTAEKVGDEGTVDMMGSYIAQLEKSSWMLDAWSKNTKDQLKSVEMEKVS
ncbi:DNA starvation/stationary phase protection protein [Flagellimonas sp. HMM57]|uniref:Dps family protein n=1 Tax=unclassified Flagellimonas TaxID=2644544 RepID=UPI0013D85F14|nr:MULTISPECIES: DNA starvation/stationary phase protection protein [unclassified Flagellimonas]UII76680.1 DNA starvation/stationary phase protection protein [Flagellimonas sp. HMM57]